MKSRWALLVVILSGCAHSDFYHGVNVEDPFRHLEDLEDPQTKAWMLSEDALCRRYLGTLTHRDAIKKRLTEIWDYEKFGVPQEKAGRLFYTYNNGLQNHAVLYVDDRVLFDPNTLEHTSLRSYSISEDGKLMAYSLSKSGSDWQEWRVRNVDTGQDLPDRIEWGKFSGASWSHDNLGFYYNRYPAGNLKSENRNGQLCYHRLGTKEDRVVFERPNASFNGTVSDCGRHLVISIRTQGSLHNLIRVDDIELISKFEASYRYVGNDGDTFYFLTDLDAPKFKLISIDLKTRERKTVIPETADTLQSVSFVGPRTIARYLKDAYTRVVIDGKELPLPGLGTASGFVGDRKSKDTFYSFSGYTTPPTIYRLDGSVWRAPKVKFKPDAYETRQIFYTSKDGTRVPMFLSHRRGLKDPAPTLLYGYGGFNASETPGFSATRIAWMDMGGVFAVANIRGGGEYGRAWHEAGTKLKKQNVFDDFIAAAEWLRANKLCSKLAIEGRSNGGLLVGACMTQRPDLYDACLPGVGVMDMLRYHKFTIGWAWASDYGTSDNPDEFKALLAYSPYHNIRSGTRYPATLVTTADHDDRVFPAHSFKFYAALKNAQAGEAPVLIRIETEAGHGQGTPTAKLIEEWTDKYAFLMRFLK